MLIAGMFIGAALMFIGVILGAALITGAHNNENQDSAGRIDIP